MFVSALAAAALGGAAAAPPRPDLATPEAATVAFYSAYLRIPPTGVPGPRQRARLRGVITPRLSMLLARAGEAEAEHQRSTGGREPPYIEGDVFTSLFEGAETFRLQRCRTGAARAICQVALGHDDPRDKPAHWRDQVVLARVSGAWRVDDIIYGGDWSFGNKGRLSQTLRSAIDGE
jgi:hypothetical protein